MSRSELYSLHVTAAEHAARERCSPPRDLETLTTALHLGFDRQQLRGLLEMQRSAGSDLATWRARGGGAQCG